MKIIGLIGTFLTLTGISLPNSLLISHANENQILLRYAEENIGSLQTLNDFNISTSNVVVTNDFTKGIVMTTGGGQASSVFLKEQMAVDQTSPGFSTYFVMNVYKLNAGSGDGYVFIISANSNALGQPGGGLGYGGISNSLGIEFDFYDNGGEAIASSDIFLNGSMATTPGTRFDADFPSRWNGTSTGNLVRAYHTWIEYDYTNSILELRVDLSNNSDPSVGRPPRPANALIRRTGFNAPQISQFFYAGFSAGTGGAAQMNGLKSWYFSNAFIPGGIDLTKPSVVDNIIVDNIPPTAPEVTIQPEVPYLATLSGGTDNNQVAGYQYRTPSSNWITYTDPIEISATGTYQTRTIDRAGNTSSVSLFSKIDIAYYVGGQIILNESVYVLGTEYTLERTFEVEPNRYRNWYTASNFSGVPVTKINASANVISLYGKPEQYLFSINYEFNGGSSENTLPNAVEIDALLTLTPPTRTGYTFSGWFTDSNLFTPYNSTVALNKDTTLYAKWTINQYTFTVVSQFQANPIAVLTLDYNSTITALPTPTQAGYTFGGWFEGENEVTVGFRIPDRHVTIEARWIALSSTVIFVSPTDTSIMTMTSGQAIGSLPTVESKPGYTFLGWSLSPNNPSQIINESTVIENGLTVRLYPIWSKTSTPSLISQLSTQLFNQPSVDWVDLITFTTIVVFSGIMLGIYVRKQYGTI
jgi:uncharacterized repeat protein (TIGR02543 family)